MYQALHTQYGITIAVLGTETLDSLPNFNMPKYLPCINSTRYEALPSISEAR